MISDCSFASSLLNRYVLPSISSSSRFPFPLCFWKSVSAAFMIPFVSLESSRCVCLLCLPLSVVEGLIVLTSSSSVTHFRSCCSLGASWFVCVLTLCCAAPTHLRYFIFIRRKFLPVGSGFCETQSHAVNIAVLSSLFQVLPKFLFGDTSFAGSSLSVIVNVYCD